MRGGLPDFTNLFSPNNFKKKKKEQDDIKLKYVR